MIEGDIIFLSDHGEPARAFIHPTGLKIPAHKPDGMIATNIPETRLPVLPSETIDVFGAILQYYKTEDDQNAEPGPDSVELTAEEQKMVEDRLRDLGYLE